MKRNLALILILAAWMAIPSAQAECGNGKNEFELPFGQIVKGRVDPAVTEKVCVRYQYSTNRGPVTNAIESWDLFGVVDLQSFGGAICLFAIWKLPHAPLLSTDQEQHFGLVQGWYRCGNSDQSFEKVDIGDIEEDWGVTISKNPGLIFRGYTIERQSPTSERNTNVIAILEFRNRNNETKGIAINLGSGVF
jgi:hypothetical protein